MQVPPNSGRENWDDANLAALQINRLLVGFSLALLKADKLCNARRQACNKNNECIKIVSA